MGFPPLPAPAAPTGTTGLGETSLPGVSSRLLFLPSPPAAGGESGGVSRSPSRTLRREEGAAQQISSLNPRRSTLWAPWTVPFPPHSRRGLQNPADSHGPTFYYVCEPGLRRSPNAPTTPKGDFINIVVVNARSPPRWSCPAVPGVRGGPRSPGARAPTGLWEPPPPSSPPGGCCARAPALHFPTLCPPARLPPLPPIPVAP